MLWNSEPLVYKVILVSASVVLIIFAQFNIHPTRSQQSKSNYTECFLIFVSRRSKLAFYIQLTPNERRARELDREVARQGNFHDYLLPISMNFGYARLQSNSIQKTVYFTCALFYIMSDVLQICRKSIGRILKKFKWNSAIVNFAQYIYDV